MLEQPPELLPQKGERKPEALPVIDATPALAKGTAGVGLAGGTKRATTAKPEALEARVWAGFAGNAAARRGQSRM